MKRRPRDTRQVLASDGTGNELPLCTLLVITSVDNTRIHCWLFRTELERFRNLWRQSRHPDRMNPYYLTNILLGSLFTLKLLISAYNRFNGLNITGTSLYVLLIASGLFYMGMFPFAQYLTGQKTITNKSPFSSKTPYNRDDRCLIFYLAYSFIFLFSGTLVILALWYANWQLVASEAYLYASVWRLNVI